METTAPSVELPSSHFRYFGQAARVYEVRDAHKTKFRTSGRLPGYTGAKSIRSAFGLHDALANPNGTGTILGDSASKLKLHAKCRT